MSVWQSLSLHQPPAVGTEVGADRWDVSLYIHHIRCTDCWRHSTVRVVCLPLVLTTNPCILFSWGGEAYTAYIVYSIYRIYIYIQTPVKVFILITWSWHFAADWEPQLEESSENTSQGFTVVVSRRRQRAVLGSGSSITLLSFIL